MSRDVNPCRAVLRGFAPFAEAVQREATTVAEPDWAGSPGVRQRALQSGCGDRRDRVAGDADRVVMRGVHQAVRCGPVGDGQLVDQADPRQRRDSAVDRHQVDLDAGSGRFWYSSGAVW